MTTRATRGWEATLLLAFLAGRETPVLIPHNFCLLIKIRVQSAYKWDFENSTLNWNMSVVVFSAFKRYSAHFSAAWAFFYIHNLSKKSSILSLEKNGFIPFLKIIKKRRRKAIYSHLSLSDSRKQIVYEITDCVGGFLSCRAVDLFWVSLVAELLLYIWNWLILIRKPRGVAQLHCLAIAGY